MKTSSRKLIIIAVIVILAVAGIAFLMYGKSSPKPTGVSPNQTSSPVVNVSPKPSPTPTVSVNRAQVRANFIKDCAQKIGQNRTSDCTCTADYLSTHYSDLQLVKFYYEYHSSGQVPTEVKAALDSCSAK